MPKPGPTWLEVWTRRSRLRSATQFSSLDTPSRGTTRNAKAVPIVALEEEITIISETTPPVVDNAAGGKGNQNRQREGVYCPEGDDDDYIEPDYRLFLNHLKRQREEDNGDCPEEEYHDDDAEPDYRLFLNHLKLDGKSYRLEMTVAVSGLPVCLKYEDAGDSCTAALPPSGNGSSQMTYDGANNNQKRRSNEFANPIPLKLEADASEIDEDYQFFWKQVRTYNDLMILKLDDNVIVRYEEDEEEEEEEGEDDGAPQEVHSLEEVQELHIKTEDIEDDYPSNTKMALQLYNFSHQPSIYSEDEDDGCSMEIVGYTTPPCYGHRLKIILDKPFDISEYDMLLSLATDRTPVRKLKHLRNMTKAYETKELGSSYFDYFPQLKEMVRRADHREGLNLLRGFFYWLQNIDHDGAFKPWECASSSYKTLPTSGVQIEILEK